MMYKDVDPTTMSKVDVVILTKVEYRKLLDRIAKLDALEEGGVDNWGGYGYAIMTFFRPIFDDSEDIIAG